ncbi:MAG TPA: hypothetical protein VMI31_05510, partial [Fimbriimonadaceae bacterium]|nr:hypothetical protein [Fimbriimonadaceae bacterium]
MQSELERRPLFVAALGLVLGLTLVLHPLHLLFLLPAPFLLRTLKSRAALALAVLVGVFFGPGPDPPPIVDQFVSGEWRVETMPVILPQSQMTVISQGAIRLILFYDGPIPLCPGSVVRIRGVAKPPKEGHEELYRLRSAAGSIDVAAGR